MSGDCGLRELRHFVCTLVFLQSARRLLNVFVALIHVRCALTYNHKDERTTCFKIYGLVCECC